MLVLEMAMAKMKFVSYTKGQKPIC